MGQFNTDWGDIACKSWIIRGRYALKLMERNISRIVLQRILWGYSDFNDSITWNLLPITRPFILREYVYNVSLICPFTRIYKSTPLYSIKFLGIYHNPYFVRKLHLKFIVKILIFRFQKYVFKRRAKRKCLFGYVPDEANEYWAPREENDAGFTCVSWLFRKAEIGTWLRRSLSRNNHR